MLNFPSRIRNFECLYQGRTRHGIGTFTLHCYAYANACVAGAVTRRACTASIVLESLQATRVMRTSRSPSPPALFHHTQQGRGGRKFVFPVWIFLCLRVDIVRLATNRPSFLKRYPAFCPCATLSKTSLEYGENVGERYSNVLLLLLRKSSRREFVLSISVDGGLVPVTSVFSAKSLSRVPHFQ